jgi:Rrf2 family iron-sulfur cluster assembly transcriptional regulator
MFEVHGKEQFSKKTKSKYFDLFEVKFEKIRIYTKNKRFYSTLHWAKVGPLPSTQWCLYSKEIGMRLSTRGRFAINAMIDLALRERRSPVPLSELALRHGISLSYLEQVFAKLRQHGLVESTRGPGGGYTLGFRGDAISVADIVSAIEDSSPTPQEAPEPGAGGPTDMTQGLWDQLHSALMLHMQTISLRSLAQEQRNKGFQVMERKTESKGILKNPSAGLELPSAPNSVFALGQWLPRRT